MRLRFASLIFAVCLPFSINAQVTDEQPLSRKLGRDLAQQTIYWVEKEGLEPRSKEQYEERKRALLELIDTEGDTIDRQQLYDRVRALLNTLDTDGHTSLSTKARSAASAAATSPKATAEAALIKLIETPAGKVLVLTPPQITGGDTERLREYLQGGLRNMGASELPKQACALLIDLGMQKGGNAWPPMDLLEPLFTDANTARFVNREGLRKPVFTRALLDARKLLYAGGLENPLKRFAGQPLAFVQSRSTSSAGEMIAIALLGEGARSFGWDSYGMTTANRPIPLPDNATLVLTSLRYSIGDAAVIRGPLKPQDPAAQNEDLDAVLLRAATWSAQHSSLCK